MGRKTVLWDLACNRALSKMCEGVVITREQKGAAFEVSLLSRYYPAPSFQQTPGQGTDFGAYIMCGEELVIVHHMMNLCHAS